MTLIRINRLAKSLYDKYTQSYVTTTFPKIPWEDRLASLRTHWKKIAVIVMMRDARLKKRRTP